MKKKWRWIALAVLVGGGALVATFWPQDGGERARGPVPSEAYVWQRRWTDEVREALERSRDSLQGYIALGAEIDWAKGRPRVIRVPFRPDSLRATGHPWGLALRIGPYPGPFRRDDEAIRFILDEAERLVSAHLEDASPPAELEIDFDCATSKLDGYRIWVEEIRRRLSPLRVVVTALPAWLESASFRRLVEASDGFVLQVHSLERPAHPDAPFHLLDPRSARRWVERVAKLAVPFRVALPTYGYEVAFARDGSLLGLVADGPGVRWPESATIRQVRSDATAIADLVAGWIDDRPEVLEGIIWYRLPVGREQRNWSWTTLGTVLQGRRPQPDLRALATHTGEGLTEVEVVNRGDADAPLDVMLTVRWKRSRPVSSDALGGFSLEASDDRHSVLSAGTTLRGARLSPGERWPAGWLRLSEEEEVEIDVETKRR